MAQAKVIIKAEDNITKAVNSAKNSLSSLEGAVVKMGSILKNALGFTMRFRLLLKSSLS